MRCYDQKKKGEWACLKKPPCMFLSYYYTRSDKSYNLKVLLRAAAATACELRSQVEGREEEKRLWRRCVLSK